MDPRNQSHTNSEKGYKTCTNLHLDLQANAGIPF